MTNNRKTVTEDDLHAYVDDRLDEARKAEVELWLRDNPDAAAEVRQWKTQATALKTMFSAYAMPRDGDDELLKPAGSAGSSSTPWRKAALLAASLLLFLSGTAAGVFGGHLLGGPAPLESAGGLESLPGQSKTAFLVYASEKRHPVEVGADQEAQLVAWLGKRLDYRLVAPDLKPQGFSLVGGRLLPVNGKAGAMLMYENTAGKRLTILLGKNPENRETSFRFESANALETFYWIDGTIGYAVTGELSRERLQAVAEECYRQFES